MQKTNLLIFILAVGTFSILNTEVGIIGILPIVAETFAIDIATAGLLVSSFALIIAGSGIIMPLLFSGFNRKYIMLLVLGIFTISNIISMIAPNFTIALIARVIPAFFHPIYCSMAFSVAASLVAKQDIPKASAKIMMGVSAGIVIGIPITSFIANNFSFQSAMLFFAIINAIALIATMIFMPSMPVKKRLSYGSQLNVLKKAYTWLSLLVTVSIGAALFSVYAYIAQYFESVTNLTGNFLSIALLIFGCSSILGNYLGGNLLAKNATKTALSYPFIFILIYTLLFIFGSNLLPMVFLTMAWGILNGISNNIQQYWIISAIPEAPDFGNGLFISFGNLGTTIGTFVGGFLLANYGIHYTIMGGIFFLLISFIAILIRVKQDNQQIVDISL